MTLPGIEQFEELDVLRSCCRSSFWRFIREAWHLVPGAGTPVWNWHMRAIADEMQRRAEDVFAGRPRRHDVVINISPGTSKSTICSILFHPWTWTRMPTARHLNASHTSDLVLDLAYKSREVIRSEWYRDLFPEVVLCEDADAKGLFRNTAGGDRLACTVAGRSPMGFHAHFLTVDDPIDPKKVLSAAELKTAREFMTSVLPTRKVDKKVSVTFLIMQRLHAEDPTAVMLETARKAGATPVKHYCLPAELTKLDDGSWDAAAVKPRKLASHYVDGVMDPGRLDRAVLNTFRAQLGAYGFAGQFLQSPTPPGGGMFKAVYFNQRVKAAPYHAKRIRYWDRACLIAGTMVETIAGPKPIESIIAGELVLTRMGPKRVVQSGITKTVDRFALTCVGFPNGSSLIGTRDHLVWTINRGWVELGRLAFSDQCVMWRESVPTKMHPWSPADSSRVPVYDLTVEDAHEFFANGILVHNSTDGGGCRTAGVLLSLAGDGNLYIEHVVAGQWEPTERNEVMRATAMRDRLRYGPKNAPVIWVEAEGGSSGRDAWKGVAMALAGFPVREDRVTGNKVTRAEPWSSQLAARNVFVVDNDGSPDWDVQGYVDEHVAFPLGKLKDVVDASSGAFNLLVGRKASPQLRVLSVGGKKGLTRIVACSKEELGVVIVDEPAIIVVVEDPPPPGEAASPEGSLPPHSCLKLVEGLRLTFADVAPSEVQSTWNEPLESCGRKPEEVIMRPEDGKRMWAAISKKRSGPAPILLFVDDGGDDRRALSMAMGVSDVIGQPRSAIHRPSRPDEAVSGDPPNAHVHAVVKASRSSVV